MRLLSSAMVLVYLAGMGFIAVPWPGRVLGTLRDWWLVLCCAWSAGPLLLAEIGAIRLGAISETGGHSRAGKRAMVADVEAATALLPLTTGAAIDRLLKPGTSRRLPLPDPTAPRLPRA